MTLITATAQLYAPRTALANFAARVPNLPAWSGFFRSVGDLVDGHYPVQTPVGLIQTRIEHSSNPGSDQISICSLIKGRSERAELVLTDDGDGVRAHFTIDLLGDPAPDVREQQRARMRSELETLESVTAPA